MAGDSSGADHYPVYLGVWTNWSRGNVLGVTLTLGRQEANLLIAFTAFFIAFISTRFWRILCFAFHRQYATTITQKVVYHQRQAILRNSATPEEGIQQLIRLVWANRHRNDRFAPCLVILVAAVCMSAFAVAGGLSSQISTAVGTEVLIDSFNCGYIDPKKIQDPDGQVSFPQQHFALVPNRAETIDNAANYAQQCYLDDTAGTLDCGRFVTKKLESIIDNKATCPFQDKMCRSNSTNIRIDSGYINSHEHLGHNYPVEDRILLRNVFHCAPITTTGFTSKASALGDDLTLYHYGSVLAPSGEKDYVFAAQSVESQYALALSSNFSFATANYAPSTDEWYQVSPTQTDIFASTGSSEVDSTPIYLPLNPASPLGCVDQYQFCLRDTQHCGPLASLRDAVSGAAHLFNTTFDDFIANAANTTSAGRFNFVMSTFRDNQYASPYEMIAQLGSQSLASKNSLSAGLQGPLPSNQWQLDVIYWSDIVKASIQAAFLDMVYFNPPDASQLQLRRGFTAPNSKSLCNNQKIRSTAYASFSVFGLLFTFVVGSLIMITSYLLEPISKLLHKKWDFKTHAHLEWTTNATLQLQRLAHEELGFGTWSKGTEEIPTTAPNDLLGCLDISNIKHPILSPHSAEGNQLDHEIPQSTTIVDHNQSAERLSLEHVHNEGPPSLVSEHAPQISPIQVSQTSSLQVDSSMEIGEVPQDDRSEPYERLLKHRTI
ncbi:hypothetical protein GQX73_g4747 [Xylaria multiplex]|uniref:Uncharacterized protein n=1 Tax=Xylaria multiplex TaxID=323545 RepID=A0A7C8IQR4_9PEZI|nr:hypothetical protein GQX73_g4747 [Xylaria multiplex]